MHKLFTKSSMPLVIEYAEGHKFPRSLPDIGFHRLKEFVKAQFVRRNGDDEGFEVDYETYNFVVKFF